MALMGSTPSCNQAAAIRRVAPSGRFWLMLDASARTGPILANFILNALRPVASLVKEIREPQDVYILLMQLRTNDVVRSAPRSGSSHRELRRAGIPRRLTHPLAPGAPPVRSRYLIQVLVATSTVLTENGASAVGPDRHFTAGGVEE